MVTTAACASTDFSEGDLDSIPDNVVARILPATVFGTSFVDLVVHDEPSGDSLESGAVIPADQTQDTLELQQALDDIDRPAKALGPAELASAIGSAAQAVDGRGEQLGEIVNTLTAYLARLNPQLPLVRSDLRKLATNLEVVDDVAPDLLDATEDGLVMLNTIVTQQAAIRAIIVGGTSLTSTATAFRNENRADAVRVINDGAILLDSLYDNRHAGISGSIATNIALGTELPSILDHGFALTDAQMRTTPRRTTPRPTARGSPGQVWAEDSGVTNEHPHDRDRQGRREVRGVRARQRTPADAARQHDGQRPGRRLPHLSTPSSPTSAASAPETTSRWPASGSAGSSRSRSTATPPRSASSSPTSSRSSTTPRS